jgi:hypothetical protein
VVDQTRRNQRTIAVRPTDGDSTSGFHQGQAGMRLTLKSGCMAAIYAFKPSPMRAWQTGGVHAWLQVVLAVEFGSKAYVARGFANSDEPRRMRLLWC